MPSLRSPFRLAGRLVTDQARRLHVALESLAAEVRAAIARAVGKATGEAVREALRVILDGPPGRLPDDRPPDRERVWGEPARRSWPTTSYDPYAQDPYNRDPDDPEEDTAYGYVPADAEASEGSAEAMRAGAWSRAVATGCQAASWWLRRHPGQFSLIAAAAIGVAAGVCSLVGGKFVAASSAVAASALGILALADAARSAAGLAADAVE